MIKQLTIEEKKQFDTARRKQQAIKVLAAQWDTFKDYHKQTYPDTEFHYNGRKLASVKGQDGKPWFDMESFLAANPRMAKEVARFTIQSTVQVFRFH